MICLLLLLTHCEQEEDFHVENLNHNVIMILGHAGMGDLYKYPNNSWESIEPVIGIGADGTELDVQITKDSVLILFHDETLDGRTRCGGFTSPYDYNWSAIKDCHYNSLFADIPIYSVDEVFERIPDLNKLYFSFDCKLAPGLSGNASYRLQFLRAIHKICEKYKMSDRVFIEGDLDLLIKAKELGMNNKGFAIGSSLEDVISNQIFGIGTSIDSPAAEEIEIAHANGIQVMMWGAKTDIGNKQAIRLNPDIIQTDKPIPILMLFNRFNFDYDIP